VRKSFTVTTYTEVGPDDRDVALFLVNHLQRINIWRLPLKAWVARQDGEIVVVLTFENVTYPAIHIITNDKFPRPFMRVIKLWRIAEAWFRAAGMPMVAAPVFNHLYHFQSLLRRFGFTKIGEEYEDGHPVETVYGYNFKETLNADQVRTGV